MYKGYKIVKIFDLYTIKGDTKYPFVLQRTVTRPETPRRTL